MKNLCLVFLTFLLFCSLRVLAEDAVSLELSGFNQLTVPESNTMMLERVNKRSEFSSLINQNETDFFTSEDEIFESETGQIFSNFINDKVINNKLNSKLCH